MTDQFDPGYRMLVVACKSDKRWFDLDAVREVNPNGQGVGRPAGVRTGDISAKPLSASNGGNHRMPIATSNPAGAPPLDYWLIDTQAGVDRVLKSMLPERVCKICGEPSRRIVGETRYESTVGGRVVLNMQEGERLAENVNQWKGEGGRPGHFVKVNDTLGWSDCGCRCGDCLACSEGPDSEFPCIKKWRAGIVLDPFDLTTEGTNMGEARYIIGDVFDTLATLEDNSVDLVFSSPPFLALRSYLPADHPDKAKEIGSEATPADFLDTLLDVVEACDRVLAPHGSLVFELGDTFAGSGGGGGDYKPGNMRDGQPVFSGSAAAERTEWTKYYRGGEPPERRELTDNWPLPKSLCGLPTLFAWSLAYGRNLLRPERETPRWRIRNLIVWARPNPPVGALGDKFRPATSYLTVACKSDKRWFDLDAVRTPHQEASRLRGTPRMKNHSAENAHTGWNHDDPEREQNPAGAPPLDYWEIPTHPFPGAHYATFPPALCIKPIKSMCPERVCRVCGEPSRRLTGEMVAGSPRLAIHLRERREALGLTQKDVAKHFPSATGGVTGCVWNWEAGMNVPTPEQWPTLQKVLGLSDEFAHLIGTPSTVAFEARTAAGLGASDSARSSVDGVRPSLKQADRTSETLGWTDCGHDDYRAGVVCDPFAGSGTTGAVATGHGRDAILIDLDARNFELARERVGPMFLPEPEFVGEPFQFPKVEDVQTDAEVL